LLKSIYAIETGSGAYIPSYTYPVGTTPIEARFNCCNSVGYCGATQIGGGLADVLGLDKHEDQETHLDICMTEDEGMDHFIMEARWLLIKKWCTQNLAECAPRSNYSTWIAYEEDGMDLAGMVGIPTITTREQVEDFIYGWYGSTTQQDHRDNWPYDATYVDATMACMGLLPEDQLNAHAADGGWYDWLHPVGGVSGGEKCPVND